MEVFNLLYNNDVIREISTIGQNLLDHHADIIFVLGFCFNINQHRKKVDYYAEEEDSVSDSMMRILIHLSMKFSVMKKHTMH